jgi:deoxyribodipyrimidine photo-lyase
MSKRSDPDHPELTRPSTKRAKMIDQDTPFNELSEKIDAQDAKEDVAKVAHWFRGQDLRIHDNIALHHASEQAKTVKKPLLCFYLHCPEEVVWHGLSPARTDFMHETLRDLQSELKDLDIPLVFVTAEKRDGIAGAVTKFLKDHGVSHLHANYEYEVDELRRDIKVTDTAGAAFHTVLYHDQCVMEPGTMTTGSGGPMKVFTPYHKAWLAEVKASPDLLDTVSAPSKNDQSARKALSDLFDSKLPDMSGKRDFQSTEERDRIRKLWPAGHAAGMRRMDQFIKRNIEEYAATRSQPAADSTSRMSAYFSVGAVSMREVLCMVQKHNKGSADFSSPSGSSPGVSAWVREIVFRELYRQTTMTCPHTSMNLPQNLKFEFVQWNEDEEGWKKWCEGRTGVPFVDAGMRQLAHEAYMHNRLRMNVSSYLTCNLLIDYRRGERFFAEHLVDWDLNNNTQGWEPSYTVFNPVSQAEKNDPDGEYIRKWVPELKDVKGKAVFSPHNRLDKAEFAKLGYPEPHVDWHKTKARAMERFKTDMKDAVP